MGGGLPQRKAFGCGCVKMPVVWQSMGVRAIGIDAVDIARFRTVLKAKKARFLDTTFSPIERKYCTSFRDSAPHFAGTFAAKEAVVKALGGFHSPLGELEIRREKSGQPSVWIRGKRSTKILVSITHTSTLASAVAVQK
jgi:holo-[acyl-carrier protein] synthase